MPDAIHLEAARLLRIHAVEIERAATVGGRWDGSEPEAEAEYRHLLEVAVALEAERSRGSRVECREPDPPVLCGHDLVRLPDGGYQCLRCDRLGDFVDGMIRWRS